MGILQLLEGILDSWLVLCRNLVANLLELILCLENHRVGLIHLVNTFALFLISLGILFGLCLHAVDFVLRQTGRRLDADGLLLTSGLILGRYLQNTVGINVEGYLNLRNTTTGRGNTSQVEDTQLLVLVCHRTLTLQYADGHLCLIVSCC